MKKHVLLLFLSAGLMTGSARQPSGVLAGLVQHIQYHPSDTAAWAALQTWFDTTKLAPELLQLHLSDALQGLDSTGNVRLRSELLRQNGISHMDRGDYQQASDLLMQALRGFESAGQESGIAATRINLGALNYYLNQFREAIDYWELAAAYYERHGPPARLGNAYSNLGSVFSELEQLDSAENYHRRALRIHEKANDIKGMAQAWNNLGVAFEYGKRYREALNCYAKAQALCDSIHDQAGAIRAVLNSATILETQHKLTEALAANRHALALMATCPVKALYRLAYLNLAGVYHKMGRFREAFESLEQYQTYKDSLINEENTRYIQNLQVVHDTENKEKEIALLSRESETQALRLEHQRLLTAGLFLIVLLLVALAWTVLRHQRRTLHLLHNILPAAVVTELRQTGRVRARRHEAVTVLFADLAGFTELGQSLSPEALVGLIDRYYRAFDEIIERHGIEKIKTIGDAYMCVSGLPEPHPEHARVMLTAAQDMLAWVQQHIGRETGLPHLPLRIGLHSGPVVAGVAGKSKYAYDIWGDTVNTAARMEQFGVPGRINLSEATWRLLGGRVQAEPREPVEVKGIGWMQMYVTGGATPDPVPQTYPSGGFSAPGSN